MSEPQLLPCFPILTSYLVSLYLIRVVKVQSGGLAALVGYHGRVGGGSSEVKLLCPAFTIFTARTKQSAGGAGEGASSIEN